MDLALVHDRITPRAIDDKSRLGALDGRVGVGEKVLQLGNRISVNVAVDQL